MPQKNKLFDFEEYKDTSEFYEAPAHWVADAVATYTMMMSLQLPDEYKHMPKPEVRGTLKNALKETLALVEGGKVSEATHRPKEHVYSLRAWFCEGILDFLFADRRIWKSARWTIKDVREHTPKALSMLIQDIRED